MAITGQAEKGATMEDMEKGTIKEMIEWMTEKGHTEDEIMECIRRMVGAKPKEKNKAE